jgi:c-di-GMP-binding flagellar brake protein YcgR
MENQSNYLISSPGKIVSKLNILLKNENLLTAFFSGGSANSFVTTILEVNQKDNVFICDGCDEELVAQLLKSPKVSFKTEHLGALVTFDSGNLRKTEYQGNLAFLVPIPSALRWLEQREFYRMRVPTQTTSRCQMELNGQGTVAFKLFDISLRGFSMVNTSDEMSGLLNAGDQFDKCRLILEDKEEVSVAFEIRGKFVVNANNLNKMEKIGCKFTKITPAFENIIHGYMLKIERELLKKRAEKSGLA